MFSHSRLLAVLFSLILLSLNSWSVYAKKQQKSIRIGIIQHFGKDQNKNNLLVRSKDPNDYLEIKIPRDPFSYEYSESQDLEKNRGVKELKISTKSFPLSESWEKEQKKSRLIVGSFRNYETAFTNKQALEKLFPEQEWLVVYPDPWQIWSYADYSESLNQKLVELEKDFVWVEVSHFSDKALTWENAGFRFHRRKMLIRSKSGHNLIVNKREYPGEIEISQDSFGTYSVINELPLEEYLRGVVPFEIGASAPFEATKAQAVLARTYALANLGRFSPENYNLCATQHCQVYKGVGYYNPKIDQAIKQTTGQILVNPDQANQTAQVFYYSSDGGHSADYQDNWFADRKETAFNNLIGRVTCSKLDPKQNFSNIDFLAEFLKKKPSTLGCLDSSSSYARWSKEFTQASLNQQLKKAKKRWKFNWPDFSNVKNLSIDKVSRTGRVLELSVETSDPKNSFTILKDDIRAALGLKSTLFIVERQLSGSIFKILGAGFGHGVGLSQYGAMQLAKQNKNYQEILSFYFPKYKLERKN